MLTKTKYFRTIQHVTYTLRRNLLLKHNVKNIFTYIPQVYSEYIFYMNRQ